MTGDYYLGPVLGKLAGDDGETVVLYLEGGHRITGVYQKGMSDTHWLRLLSIHKDQQRLIQVRTDAVIGIEHRTRSY